MDNIVPQSITQVQFDFDQLAMMPVPEIFEFVQPVVQPVLEPDQKQWWSDLEYQRIPDSPGIYCIVNMKDQSFYVGSAKSLKDRKHRHFLDLRADNHKNAHLQRAYNRDGLKSFRFCILEHVEHVENLISREQYYIDTLDPRYNIARTAGSNLGMTCSDETKSKMSTARRSHPKMLEQMEKLNADRTGNPLSPEHRANIGAAQVGREKTPETRTKLSNAHKGKKKSPEHAANISAGKMGHTVSEATRAKISASKKGQKLTPEHRAKIGAAHTGRTHSEESKAKMRVANLGREHTSEAKANMSAGQRGRKASPETREKLRMRKNNLGNKHSEESKAKMRAAKFGRKQSPETIAKRVATQKANREAKLAEQQSE